MENEKKDVAAAVEGNCGYCGKKHIMTLIENDEGKPKTCAMCEDNITEPCGFDFFLSESTDQFVCKSCATKYAPWLIPIQEQALFYVKLVTEKAKQDLWRDVRGQVMQAINEPAEKRIMKVFELENEPF